MLWITQILQANYISLLAVEIINYFFCAPEIQDRGAYCFCLVCHSVILSETLTLLKTFEQ